MKSIDATVETKAQTDEEIDINDATVETIFQFLGKKKKEKKSNVFFYIAESVRVAAKSNSQTQNHFYQIVYDKRSQKMYSMIIIFQFLWKKKKEKKSKIFFYIETKSIFFFY